LVELEEIYSKNQLKNPGAETGDTTDWVVADVTVVDGGTKGDKCFLLGPTASMSQEVVIPIQPPDCKLTADFLPEIEYPGNDTGVKALLKIEYEYADGTKDAFILPCMPGGGEGGVD
jgi:hypothetical protein